MTLSCIHGKHLSYKKYYHLSFKILILFQKYNIFLSEIQDSNEYDLSFQKYQISMFSIFKINSGKNIRRKIISFRNFSNSINYCLWNPGIMLEWLKHFWNNLRFFSNVICKGLSAKWADGIWKISGESEKIPLSQNSTVFTQYGKDALYKQEMFSSLWKNSLICPINDLFPIFGLDCKTITKNAGKMKVWAKNTKKKKRNCGKEEKYVGDPGYNVCGTQTSCALTALIHESQ